MGILVYLLIDSTHNSTTIFPLFTSYHIFSILYLTLTKLNLSPFFCLHNAQNYTLPLPFHLSFFITTTLTRSHSFINSLFSFNSIFYWYNISFLNYIHRFRNSSVNSSFSKGVTLWGRKTKLSQFFGFCELNLIVSLNWWKKGGGKRWVKKNMRRLMIGSVAPTCTYNECRGCKYKCRAEQVPVEGNDPMNSPYHYKCVCHR